MIEFLKNLIKSVNFKSDNEELNKYNKIIYAIIIICAIIFIGVIIFYVIKYLPAFFSSAQESWDDSKTLLNRKNFMKR